MDWKWEKDGKQNFGGFAIYQFDLMLDSHEQEDKLWSTWYEEEDIERIKQYPLTIEQYIKVVTGYFGLYGIRHHLYKDEFHKNPFEVYPKLKN